MCLAVPGRLVTKEGDEGIVDLHGNQLRIHLALVPEAAVGDWLLIHAGFAIQMIDAQTAHETWSLLQQVQAFADAPLEHTP